MRLRSTISMMALAAGVAGFTTGAFAQGSGPSGQSPGGVNAGDSTAPVTGATPDRRTGSPSMGGSTAPGGTDGQGARAARQAGATNMDKGTAADPATRPSSAQRRATPRENTAAEGAPRGVQPQIRQNEPSSPPYPGTGRARNNTADPSRTSPQ